MAVAVGVHWVARPADGSDSLNGGGFTAGASGTDYSNQPSTQYSLTGLTSSGSGNVLLTSSASADMVGNIARTISGTNLTAGRFEILSVVVGVSITFSTNVGGSAIASGVVASGAINIGGAVATIATVYAQGTAGNTYYLKGTLTISTPQTLNVGSTTAPTLFEGFGTTLGDGVQATWTTSTNSIEGVVAGDGHGGFKFRYIIFSSTAGTPGNGISAGTNPDFMWVLDSCRITGFHNNIHGPFSTQFYFEPIDCYNCEIDHATNMGINNVAGVRLAGCSIHDNASDGVSVLSSHGTHYGLHATYCAFWKNGGKGADCGTDGTAYLINCVFVDNTGVGVLFGADTSGILWNNIFYNNGTYGADFGSHGSVISARCNAFGANATAPSRGLGTGVGDVTLSGDPFNGRSTGDFTLLSTGAGSQCRGTAFQGTLFGNAAASNLDIGCVQHAAGGGGGGGLMVSTGMTGGMRG